MAFSRSSGYCWVAKRRLRLMRVLSMQCGACTEPTRLRYS
ncbi:Uncharacterised protein [Mycobacterium tuberculosis]|nr:Uncharacterised protein [Mycobacterium tuberculosis]CPA75637.1 Uncharacterised protein [Mycobacterium tuberculosis]